jgi:hypothetical protein
MKGAHTVNVKAHLLKRLVPLIIVLVLASSAFSNQAEIGVRLDQQAPDFTLPQVDGDPVTLSDVVAENDVTILYFFLAAS